jgi:hypothetical protein
MEHCELPEVIIDLSDLSDIKASEIIKTYFESICTNSQPTYVIDLIEYLLQLNKFDINELCKIINEYTKSDLLSKKNKILSEMKKYNQLRNLTNFLIDYIKISEFVNVILEKYTKLNGISNIIVIRLNQLSTLYFNDIKIIRYICESFFTNDCKKDIIQFFNIIIYNKYFITDNYKIANNIFDNIGCMCKQILLEMSNTPLSSSYQYIQNIQNSILKCIKIKNNYPFINNICVSANTQQTEKQPKKISKNLENTYFNIIAIPIYHYILENILFLLLCESTTLDHVLIVFTNNYYFLEKYIFSPIFNDSITNISHVLPTFINKILETISDVENIISFFALLEYVYKIINNKTDIGRVKTHIKDFVNIAEHTDLLIETIHELILQPDTCSNYKINILIRIIEHIPTSNITFIDKYYQLLSQRLIHNINIKNKEVFNNYIKMEYHIWHLCKNKIQFQSFTRMVRIIDTMIEDIDFSYNNSKLDTKVLITTYGVWEIPNKSSITTSKSIENLNTPLACILQYYSKKYSENNTNKTIDWLLQCGQVTIIYEDKEITMQPIQLLKLEKVNIKCIIKNVRITGISVMNIEGIRTCLICQENLNSIDYTDINNTINIMKGGCGHVFHSECIKTWLAHNRKCPLCRKEWQYNTI